LVVILPRAATPGQSSLVYFAAIARRREAEFVATFLGQSRTEVTQNVLAGVHAESRIAQRKFRWVSMSVAFLLVTMVLVAMLGLAHVTLP
jgi:hypothetical protein